MDAVLFAAAFVLILAGTLYFSRDRRAELRDTWIDPPLPVFARRPVYDWEQEGMFRG